MFLIDQRMDLPILFHDAVFLRQCLDLICKCRKLLALLRFREHSMLLTLILLFLYVVSGRSLAEVLLCLWTSTVIIGTAWILNEILDILLGIVEEL